MGISRKRAVINSEERSLKTVLTDKSDSDVMKQRILNLLRFTLVSVSAVALVACAKVNSLADAETDVEPRRSNGPEDPLHAHVMRGRINWEEQRIDSMENQLQALTVELKGLREALEIMGPFDDVPAAADALVDVDAAHGLTMPRDETPRVSVASGEAAAFDLADIYAPPPSIHNARSIFHGVQLAAYPTQGAASADWMRLSAELDLNGLEPRFNDTGNGVRLYAGPISSRAEASGLCVELTQLAGACEPTRYQGVLN